MSSTHIYIPEFLNSIEKWNKCIYVTDTVYKFEKLMNKILNDPKITALDFYVLMKALHRDLVSYHKSDSFSSILKLVEALMSYYFHHLLS